MTLVRNGSMTKRERLVWRIELARRQVAELEAGHADIRQTGKMMEVREALEQLNRARGFLADLEKSLQDLDAEQAGNPTKGEPQGSIGRQ